MSAPSTYYESAMEAWDFIGEFGLEGVTRRMLVEKCDITERKDEDRLRRQLEWLVKHGRLRVVQEPVPNGPAPYQNRYFQIPREDWPPDDELRKRREAERGSTTPPPRESNTPAARSERRRQEAEGDQDQEHVTACGYCTSKLTWSLVKQLLKDGRAELQFVDPEDVDK